MWVALHPDARAELRAAALWYDERRLGLGAELLNAVASTLERITATPSAFPRWPGLSNPAIRRAVVERFPYVLAFEAGAERVVVLAVAHSKRRPLYWVDRTT